MRAAAWIVLAACSRAPSDFKPLPPAPSIARVDAGVTAGPDRAACDGPQSTEWRPTTSFLGSVRVMHLRVAAATPGPTWGDRCVALDLELLDTFRGTSPERPGEHIHLIIRQSMITHYTSRPAGAWWIVEQSLEPNTEYIAFCPSAKTEALRGSCVVTPAPTLLADLRLAREAEAKQLSLADLVGRVRTGCRSSSYVIASYVWERHREQALREPQAFDTIVSLIEEPSCDRIARLTLFNAVEEVQAGESPPHVRRVVRAMFHLLALPEASDMHDNLVETYIPNVLGLVGGATKTTAAQVFAGDPKARTAATAAVRAYKGRADATAVRAWLGR